MGVGVGFICNLLVVTLWTRAFLLIAPNRRWLIGPVTFGYGNLHCAFLYFYDPFACLSFSEGYGYLGWLVFLDFWRNLDLLCRCSGAY